MDFIKNNRVYRQYPCFFQMKMQNKYISENNACIRLRRWTKIKTHQPPPSLPRRGGTDTIGCMIIVCSYQIIKGLSIVIVTVPPLRGRLGGG